MSVQYDEATLQMLLARLTELETQVARLPETGEGGERAARPPQAAPSTGTVPTQARRCEPAGPVQGRPECRHGRGGRGRPAGDAHGHGEASNGQSVLLGQQNPADGYRGSF